MRVKNEQAEFLKQSIRKYLPDAVVYLIGSRHLPCVGLRNVW